MMSSTVEKAFPRGGRIPALSTKPIKAQKISLFNKPSKKVKKKLKKKKGNKELAEKNKSKKVKKSVNSTGENKLYVKHVEDLSPAVLHEGTLVLGIVSQISEKYVNISLPGGMRGIVTMLHVSQFYKDLVVTSSEETEVASLVDLFKVGDILPVKVISVSEEDGRKFFVSLDPGNINSKLNEMETGLVIVGCIKSEEDHGYIIDFGIPTVNGFLNYNKVEPKAKLPIGKLVRCAVIKCINSQNVSNVELSLLQDDLKNSFLPLGSSCPIHSFVPGLQFSLTVTKILKNGLEVSYRHDKSLRGFIYEDHLPGLFPKLSKIEVGAKFIGTLLYVKPLVNIPYFKVMSYKPQNYIYPYGKIVKGKVIKTARSGITFRIGKKLLPMKCFVPLAKLADSKKLIEHDVGMDSLYPIGKIVKEIRLTKIDYMRRCYVGATDKMTLQEKYFAVTDIKCGDIVPCKIESIEKSCVRVKIGNITGTVGFTDMTDVPLRNPGTKFKVGRKVLARVTEVKPKTQFVRLTMKPTLLNKKLKILDNYNNAMKNECYTGTILRVARSTLTVKFFNGVIGFVEKYYTPCREESTLIGHYTSGQLVKCYVRQVSGTELQLSLVPTEGTSYNLKIGEKYDVVVTSIERSGLILRVVTSDKDGTITGTIPCELLCDYPGLGEAMLCTYSVNQKFSAWHVLHIPASLPVFSISDTVSQFYEILAKEKMELDSLLAVGQIYPFIYRYFSYKTNRVVLSALLPSVEYKTFTAGMDYIFNRVDNSLPKLPIKKFQIVYGRILGFSGKRVHLSLRLSDVWDKDYHTSLSLLDSYLHSMKRLVNYHTKKKEKYVNNIKLGSRVSSVISQQDKSVVCDVDNIRNSANKDVDGEIISGTVVWIKGEKKLLCLNTVTTDVAEVQDENFELVNEMHRAKIVYIGDEVVVAALKGKGNGQIVFLPRKRHVNDFENPESPYTVGCHTKVWVERSKLNNLVAIDREVALLEEKKIWNSYEANLRSSIQSLKRKLSFERLNGKMRKIDDNESDMEIVAVKTSGKAEVKEEKHSSSDDDIRCEYVDGTLNGHVLTDEIKQEDYDVDECMDMSGVSDVMNITEEDIKSENESDTEVVRDKDKDIYSKERIFLSSSSESESDDEAQVENDGQKNLNIGFNWDVFNKRELLSGADLKPAEESSSDDEDESNNERKKRVRLTKSEKEEKAKEEEERLRAIEERMMRSDIEPETADDFDRALLAKPNSSALWLKYMAFHLQATEIEKARAVARRALKTIAFNEEQEKLNVWVALLNLENLYGNEESVNKTLGEALMRNEPYHIHLHMLNLHGQSGKFEEMERVGNMLLKKFKDVENLWQDVGLAYYKVGRLETARHVLQRALPILDKKKHVELISKFAQLENKYGSNERAQTLYETILASFPKRVDVWSCYVDMLVKSNLIDLARQVLERATSQRLPPKKMKTLFKKFLAFEEANGTPENVEKVRQSAVEYVEAIGAGRGK